MFRIILYSTILSLSIFSKSYLKLFTNGKTYEPRWKSLNSRSIPQWYDNAKVGIFLHWGVYSVPSIQDEWFWFNWKTGKEPSVSLMKLNYPRRFTYQAFAKYFTAEFFNPDEWADLFKKSGAEYVVLTTKHHDGYTLWPSTYSFSWNSQDIGPKKDIVGTLAEAVRRKELRFGTYYSLFEWYNRLYLTDVIFHYTTNKYVTSRMIPEMVELVQKYKPDIFWTDGEWETTDIYWNSTHFLTWLYNESPVKDTVVVTDRWGRNIRCSHGGVITCYDRYNPKIRDKRKFENAMTLDKYSWGYRRNTFIAEILTINKLIQEMVEAVSCGGNILINVGPTHDGRIDLIFQERLLDLGKWLEINHEAIKYTKPWKYQNDSTTGTVWYTKNEKVVYAIALHWPKNNVLTLGSANTLFETSAIVTLLGYPKQLSWKESNREVNIEFPDKATVKTDWAWALKIEPTNIK
ncbi:hypothetical protein ILUMI_13409 [Ignelater luminosus]|uniref:Putative alpha-L-fucosidase n=1 Tax=Ignelater luminosus TaxID=2038154 RepID=A0A8K0D0V2_IGNLU|nr:hypothetical protein ILUMI_13409 [Ignelater luminosus]